ncbi:EthD domain-containing protein [Pseudomonas kairouanensis]|nr:EthD domain-containing protein [Pseudomonas kairouanensis]
MNILKTIKPDLLLETPTQNPQRDQRSSAKEAALPAAVSVDPENNGRVASSRPLKVILSSTKHPSMSRAQFFNHLSNVHAPLVQSIPGINQYVRKYVQNHTRLKEDLAPINTVYPHLETRDSVIELWFDSNEMFLNLMSAPSYAEIVRPDEARFNDLSKLIILAAHEENKYYNISIAATNEPAKIKTFDFVKRKEGISPEEFLIGLKNYEKALIASRAYEENVTAHVWNSALPTASNPFGTASDYDGVIETWFQSYEALETFQQKHSALEHIFGLELEFADKINSFSVVAEEMPIYDDSQK